LATYLGLGAAEPSDDSERITADALRTLNRDWTILHHVTWQSLRDGRQGDGEADFLVIHPNVGLLVLEIKGGGVHVENGRWFSVDRHGAVHPIKNPYEQAMASKHALLKWLRNKGITGVDIGHAVVFPHLDTVPALGPAATPEITIVRPDFLKMESAIVRGAKHWSMAANLAEPDIKKLVGLLAPTVRLRRGLSEASAAAESRLIELTAEQIAAFAGLRSTRGGLILGGAGTGKTVLAIARAQQLQRDGFKTLLVCYNEILGKELSSSLGATGISAGTFHSLCFREASHAKLAFPSNASAGWWETGAPELLIEACSINRTAFDAIIVDEAQDFSPFWLDALRCLISRREDAPFYAFADPRQDLWKRSWLSNRDFPFCFELRRNLRNTHPIAEKVCACIREPIEPPFGADGPPAKWRDLRDDRRPMPEIIAAVEQLLEEGFGPQNLVVLCSSSRWVSQLREHSVGPYSFGTWRSKGIPVETVARFKGMESEAVVLVLEGGESDLDRTAAYVGISRGRTVLVVLAASQQQYFLNWQKSGL
jgi:Nuclease-related domain/AAA domain